MPLSQPHEYCWVICSGYSLMITGMPLADLLVTVLDVYLTPFSGYLFEQPGRLVYPFASSVAGRWTNLRRDGRVVEGARLESV